MSDYLGSLPLVARHRYLEKLSSLGLLEQDDPFAQSDKFIDDMSLWPPVEYGHIFCYFIERPGVYTRQQLLITIIKVAVFELWAPSKAPLCIVRAKVNPSQSSPDSSHFAWVAVISDGQGITSQSTCMAG